MPKSSISTFLKNKELIIIDDIVTIGLSMGLKVDADDIEDDIGRP